MHRNGIAVKDYSHLVKVNRTVNIERVFLTKEELFRLRDAECDPLLKGACFLSLQTGLRISDIIRLELEHIRDGAIHLDMQKTGDFIRIPLTQAASEIIDGYSPDLFRKIVRNGHMSRALYDWADRAGVHKHLSFHVFRRTFAQMQVNGGKDIRNVQHLLGHRSVVTTEQYLDTPNVEVIDPFSVPERC